MTAELAGEIATHAPESTLVVYTDKPQEFDALANVKAFRHSQQGILHCYNDKLFLLQKAIEMFPVAIHIDADTHLLSPLPDIEWKSGITSVFENLIEHVRRYRPHNLPDLKKAADKMGLTQTQWENAVWIGEALYVMVADGGKEIDFLRWWEKVGRYMELRGMHAGEGNFMGLAAAKAGYPVQAEGYALLQPVAQHWDASSSRPQATAWQKLRKRFAYHYRLNRTRLQALQDFDFYYR